MRNNDTQHIVRLSQLPTSRTVLVVAHTDSAARDEFSEISVSSFALARGVFGKITTLLLLPMIFIYPIAPAYAADENIVASTTSAEETSTASPVEETLPITDSLSADLGSALSGAAAVVAEIFSSDESTSTPAEEISATPDQPTQPTEEEIATTTEGVAPIDDTATTTDDGSFATTTPLLASSTVSGGGGSFVDEFASSTLDASSTDQLVEETTSETTEIVPQKSAQEIAAEMIQEKEDSIRSSIRKEVEDEFTKGCVALDSTGYYCLKDRTGSESMLAPSRVVTSVSSSVDSGGQYKQIFMNRAGTLEQLTFTNWDNAFPATDVSGKSVVWQGNVNGRWQIFYASVGATTTPEIVQLTRSNESNFNAKVDGGDVVWQGWVDGNWEVFLAERLPAIQYYSSSSLPEINTRLGVDNTWRVTRITTNSGHDMFPSVAGGLITWQSFQDNAWNVYVYSMKTGTTQKISKSGEKSEQPRFAITWDERTTNGNARMVGYDIASGETIDLTSVAREVNDEKPYTPTSPITQPDQAALPITGAGTSTTAKSEGDANGTSTPNGLDV